MRPYAETAVTRLDTGKKIDTWAFKLPDGKRLEIDIHLHSRGGDISFTSQTSHPAFRFLNHTNTDLQLMRSEVQRDVRSAIEAHFGADWTHGLMVEVEYDDRHTNETSHTEESRRFSLTIKVAPVHFNSSLPVGNRGETQIIARDTPQTLLQRSHRDNFDVGEGTDLSSRNMMFMGERGKAVSRVVLPDAVGLEDGLSTVQDVLRQFAARLAERMSPGRLTLEGVPVAADLVEMMARAAEPDSAVAVAEVDGFRM